MTDNGSGMEQEILPHLFEPFFTTKEVGEGTGLGLATVHGIVKQNNGSVQVRSTFNQGTTFEIYFPATECTGDAHETGQTSQLEHTAATVLLVEDEPAILEMATLLLESLGYSVLAAHAPSQALQVAQEYDGRIDLLITDVVMPEMNGPQLAQKILLLRPELRQLFMSGYSSGVMEHHGMKDKNVHFIHKPFTRIAFEKMICEALA
nr:response regulator [uncultured Desulfobulbus sp.]